MKRILPSTLAFLVVAFIIFSPRPNNVYSEKNGLQLEFKDDTIHKLSLLFVGDVMQHGPQINAAYNSATGKYDYTDCFKYVQPIISNANLAIVNFETTLAGLPYAGYPAFSAPDEIALGLKNAGFDLLITANNHCLDRTRKGLEQTIKKLNNFGIQHTGTFLNDTMREQNYPFIMVKDGFKLAFLNYTYATNGIEVQSPNVVNYIDKAQIIKDLAKAKSMNPDFVIMTMHWGVEYQREQNMEQEDLAKFCFANGADVVVGMHPHVIQPIETVSYVYQNSDKKGIVCYSLGNYVSNQRARYKDGGIMVKLELTKNTKQNITKLTDYSYIPVWVYKQELPKDTNYYVLPTARYQEFVNAFSMSAKDKSDFNQFISDTHEMMKGVKEEKE